MTVSTFNAHVRDVPGAAAIDLEGEINAFAEEALNLAFQEAEQHHPRYILLNFSEVRYVNSTGIALIVSLLARARKAGRSLIVYGLSEHYQEIFQITRLADFIPIFADETSAITAAV